MSIQTMYENKTLNEYSNRIEQADKDEQRLDSLTADILFNAEKNLSDFEDLQEEIVFDSDNEREYTLAIHQATFHNNIEPLKVVIGKAARAKAKSQVDDDSLFNGLSEMVRNQYK